MEKRNDIPPLSPDVREAMQRYISGTATASDRARVSAWYHAFDDNEVVVPVDHPDEELITKHRIWRNLQAKRAVQPPRRITRITRWLGYAAAILLAATAAVWFWVDSGQGETEKERVATDILPGGNRATLTLADGRIITLNEAQNGIIIGSKDITYADGSDIALSSAGAAGRKLTDSEELVLTTPKGGTYQVTLPDGSNVWLNANSTLRYPSRFNDKSREVMLEGEAYFSITKRRVGTDSQSLPFNVVTDGQIIEVLGTEFNISAYRGESESKTTLIEGCVRIASTSDNKPVITMQPGEQAIMRDGNLNKINVDVAGVVAWKSGKFSFDGKSFSEVMNEVARWYDLEVVYEGEKPTGQLVGDAYRNQNLSIVLGMLDVLEVQYKLDLPARKLTIYDTKGGRR